MSKDTLLRVVRRRATVPEEIPKIIGIADWAWRKGHRYGTLICDLERRKVVDLLPDREPATVAAWLAARLEDRRARQRRQLRRCRGSGPSDGN